MSNGSAPRPRARKLDPRASMPNIRAHGRKLAPYEDFYHWVLTLGWVAFFGWVTVGYMLTNLLFGAAYYALPGSVANASGFLDCFFFSVETFATIGYGEMTPLGRAGHALMTLEALAGILASATITGLTFARLARPTARILFSEKAVIAPRDGVPHLMFRMANWRRNQIAEAQLAVMVLLTETTREGETMRRPATIKLVRDKNAMFLLTWTAMHPIDQESPFYGEGAFEKLRAMNAEIYLSLTGLDDTLGQTIHTRYRYVLDDVVHNARFVDVLSINAQGLRVIDFDKFHEIEMLPGDAP
ncbi:MAG TPA: ion channel [Labilithrix sp.]|nr:ion channel [Labilithrix sp.]